MFNEFSHRHTDCLVDGAADKVILSRDSRATSITSREFLFNGVFAPNSNVRPGSRVITSETFFVQTVRPTTESDKSCTLIKTNASVEVQRYAQTYDENDNPTGESFTAVQSNVKAYAQYVTARLRQEDIGLLPSTAYILILQSNTDVKRPQDQLLLKPDRIILNGRSYQVDVVDDVKYPGLLQVQLSEDTR
ncbi:hypothetical protein SD71_16190 [Cohnella kolymensis]|uniref:Head-tail adaptor protein n=1 Tax=Cohnella kolymensis TaxID=1590652 RepID=A0ABR5A286_9BACL|nr:hypothetical protein [Cohnella kolymensis]KIL35164.1 hypothetical protein SD71_16190 [Cohnella kolymensis]